MERQRKADIAVKRKAPRELEKNQKQLETLKLESGQSLVGDSVYLLEDLKEAIEIKAEGRGSS